MKKMSKWNKGWARAANALPETVQMGIFFLLIILAALAFFYTIAIPFVKTPVAGLPSLSLWVSIPAFLVIFYLYMQWGVAWGALRSRLPEVLTTRIEGFITEHPETAGALQNYISLAIEQDDATELGERFTKVQRLLYLQKQLSKIRKDEEKISVELEGLKKELGL